MNRDPRDALLWVLPVSVAVMLGFFGVPEAHACQWGGTASSSSVHHGMHGMGLVAVLIIGLVVLLRGRMRLQAEMKRLSVAQRLIERGLEPPPDLLVAPSSSDARRGIVLMFAGLGLFAAGMFVGDRGLAAAALIPEFVGAGYLLAERLAGLGRGDRSS